jgi:hypothetical protein
VIRCSIADGLTRNARDVLDGQTRDDPQRERDLLRRGQFRVAAYKHQPQQVIAVVCVVELVDDRGLFVLRPGERILLR